MRRVIASMRSSVKIRCANDIPEGSHKPQSRNSLYSYLRQERMIFRSKTDGPFYDAHGVPRPSHNDLFGGMLAVADDDNEIQAEFARRVAEAVSRDEILGLCENRTRFSRFYLDLDYEGPVAILPDDVVHLVRQFLPIMNLAFPSVPEHARATAFRCLICMSPPKRAGPEHNLVKSGVHVIFPEIILSYENLVRLNIACREAIETLVGPRIPPENPWSDVFDISMYRTGLRMVFMDKNTPCESCKHGHVVKERPQPLRDLHTKYIETGRTTTKTSQVYLHSRFEDTSVVSKSSSCGNPRCRNGYVGQNRPYRVRRCLDGLGHEDSFRMSRLRGSMYQAILECSIRAPRVRHERPHFFVFPGCPQLPPEIQLAAFATKAKDTKGVHIARVCAGGDAEMTRAIQKESQRKTKIFLQPHDPRMHVLRTLVRSYAARFQGLEIRNAFLIQDPLLYFVNVMGPGETACMNRLHRSHQRAKVYFMVATSGITQKCTNRNPQDTERAQGACMRYQGPKMPLDSRCYEALFAKLEFKPVLALGIASSAVVPIVSNASIDTLAPMTNASCNTTTASPRMGQTGPELERESLVTLEPAPQSLVVHVLRRSNGFARCPDKLLVTNAPPVARPVADTVRKRKRVDLHQLKAK